MNRSITLALKDVKLLLRDKAALFWVLVFPLMIAILFGSIFGGSNGSSPIKIALVDQDQSKESSALVARIRKSEAINAKGSDLGSAVEAVRKSDLAAYVLIPKGFGDAARKLQYGSGPAIKIGIDPSRKAEAGMLQGVVSQAAFGGLADRFSNSAESRESIRQDLADLSQANLTPQQKEPTARFLKELDRYMGSTQTQTPASGFQGPKIEADPIAPNGAQPASSFEITFPQAIIWGLLGVVSTFVVSLVKERELGTMIRLRASPMSFGEILAGKALACFLCCAGAMVGLLILGHFVFHVRLNSPGLLTLAICSGAICIVGIMMLLSVMGSTVQSVSGSSWGMMITMAMFGGGMVPVFIMPPWMQAASNFSPLKWTVLSIEGAIWRNFSLQEMLLPCGILIATGAVCFGLGVQVLRRKGG